MGLYDRDYVREEPRGIQLGGDWSAVTTIIVINIAIYLLDLLSSTHGQSWLQEYGSLQGNLFERPWQAYQLLTYGWLHDTNNSLVHLAFNMLTLFFFGSDVEGRLYSKTRFWQFYLGSMVIAGLGWVIAQQAWFPHSVNARPAAASFCIGASGAVTAVFVYSVLRNPHRTLLFMFFPMPAWVVGLLVLAMDVAGMMNLKHAGNVAYACHLAGAASGFLFYKTNWCLGDLVPLAWLQRGWKKVNGPRVRLHRPSADHEDDLLGEEHEDLSSRVDEILAKISRSGEASLTNEERRILQNASRQFRQRQGK